MKLIGRTLTLLSLTVLLSAGWAPAQQFSVLVRATVPFELSVGNKTFPAGDYTIVRANPSTLVLRDAKNRSLAVMITTPVWSATPPSGPKLVFYKRGDRGFLVRVWQADSFTGQEILIRKLPSATPQFQEVAGNQP
jgi:hypothetical protein